PVMCYRADMIDRAQVPDTWAGYQRLIDAPGDKTDDQTMTTWEPLRSWGGVMLLTRAAAFGVRPDDRSLLFDTETMKPRITELPFERALDELRQAAARMDRGNEPGSAVERRLADPHAASWHLLSGNSRYIAIGLPPAGHRALKLAGSANQKSADGMERLGWN